MSEWKPIESAPADVMVLLGRWRTTYDESMPLRWDTEVSKVWMTTRFLFGLKRRVREIHSVKYSHWAPLPEPPKD